MNTPRKNFNYNSPYAKPVQQYPSQSEDYISLDMGGLTQIQQNAPSASSNEKTPGRYSAGKFYQQNYRNSHNKNKRRNLFNNNYNSQQNNRQQNFNQQQPPPRYTPHHNYRKSQDNSGGGGGQQQRQQNYNNRLSDKTSIANSYVHPSMTEDPWFDLVQRMQSLRKSTITLEANSPKETTPPPPTLTETSTHTDSDHTNDEEDADSVTTSSD